MQKKIALINDVTGFGRCSIAVELPVISALKVQCCPLPTSVLSNHTGFDSFYFEDFTDSMPAYIAEWKKLNLKFDGICSGFLGSHRQIKIVEDFFKTFKTDENIILVDPVMGDYGKLYSTYTTQTCTEMKKLVKYADILTPNLTEACILTDEEYDEARQSLDAVGWQVDYIITHCAPTSIALMGSRHNEADRLTDFLQEVRERAKYHYWLFGHYHDNKVIDTKHILLWEQIVQIL